MSDSLVTRLVLKDIHLMRIPIVWYWLGGILAVSIVVIGGEPLGLAGFILFVAALAAAGIHAIMATVVEERREQTLPFIMSLPITVKEYTSAKLIANLIMFLSVWITLSAVGFVVTFAGNAGQPDGLIPFATILLVSILVAYIFILAVAIVSESIGYSIAAIVVGNLGTQIFLWFVADLHAIRSVMGGAQAVWTATAVGILTVQAVSIVLLIVATYLLQARKKDFV